MQLSHKSLFVLAVVTLIGLPQAAQTAEPAAVTPPPRSAVSPLTFTHLCLRPCDCGKPTTGIMCRAPAFCCDDYCPKPLPRISLCWPKSFCDDYCRKPLLAGRRIRVHAERFVFCAR